MSEDVKRPHINSISPLPTELARFNPPSHRWSAGARDHHL